MQSVLKTKLNKFMEDVTGDDDAVAPKPRALQRIPNQNYLLAHDQALLAGTGISFKYFVAEHPVRPLEANERQFFMPPGGHDLQVPRLDPPDRRRSCILDLETGKTRLEAVFTFDEQGDVHRPALHTVSDDGPIGRPR